MEGPQNMEVCGMAEARTLLIKHIKVLAVGEHTARGIADSLLKTERDAVEAWILEELDDTLTFFVQQVLKNMRHRALKHRAISNGPVSIFEASYTVNENNTHKPLHACTKVDLLFIAAGYDRDARRARSYAQVFKAMADKVGNKTVGDVYSEDEVYELLGGN